MDGVVFYVYWVLVVPLSIVGIISNVLVVYIWCGKRYKFNRLIIMTITVANVLFVALMHASTHMEKGKTRVWVKIVAFSVRLYAVSLYVFLAAMQCVFTCNMHNGNTLPKMMSKKRIIGGLLSIAFWCIFVRAVKLVIDAQKHSNFHIIITSNIFHVLTLVLPQFLQIILVFGMVHGIRRYRRYLASGKLRNVIVKSCLLGLASNRTCTTSADRSVRQSLERLCVGKSRSNRINSESVHNVNQLLSDEVYQQRADFVQRELQVVKAVTILCIPPTFIYAVGFSVGIYIRVYMQEARETFFWVMDVLQFINCGCTLFVLAALLPSFRHALLRRLGKKDMTDSSEGGVGSTCPKRLSPPQSSSFTSDKSREEGSQDRSDGARERGGGDQSGDTGRTNSSGNSSSFYSEISPEDTHERVQT